MMENISTLIDPPGSTMDESQWLNSLLSASPDCGLLLDLHNVYANAVNFGFDALTFVRRLPLERVGTVHIAGGRWVSAESDPKERRLLDDHLHPVPSPVFELLEEVAALAEQPLTVILERDGAFPTMVEILAELDAARDAMTRGRYRQVEVEDAVAAV